MNAESTVSSDRSFKVHDSVYHRSTNKDFQDAQLSACSSGATQVLKPPLERASTFLREDVLRIPAGLEGPHAALFQNNPTLFKRRR